jgi:phosphate transport system permease protein
VSAPVAPPPLDARAARAAAIAQRTAALRARRSLVRRRRTARVMTTLTALSAAATLVPLALILWHLASAGLAVLGADFFTRPPAPAGVGGGGMSNAIVGTLVLLAIAAGVGLPVGIGAGLYLSERRGSRLATLVRFLADVLNGLPAILFGVVAWYLLVRPVGHFSAWAGGLALGAMMIPLVARATEEMLGAVPATLTEAALALGYPRWRTALRIVLRTALPGITTGALVAVARVAGETAPLLFTAFGNQYPSVRLDAPIGALPLQIYAYALSPYDEWRRQAYGGALVLIGLVALIALLARLATRGQSSPMRLLRWGRGG